MGGIIILGSVILPTLLFADLSNTFIQIILLSLIWMGVIGFLDDYLKVIKKYPRGLIARYKMAGQISLGLIIGVILIYYYPDSSQFATSISIPLDSIQSFILGTASAFNFMSQGISQASFDISCLPS